MTDEHRTEYAVEVWDDAEAFWSDELGTQLTLADARAKLESEREAWPGSRFRLVRLETRVVVLEEDDEG